MKKGLTVLLISLIFIVVACDQLPAKQYNEDGNTTVPIMFEYPYTWEIIETNDEVYVFQDIKNITVLEDGGMEMPFDDIVGIGIGIWPDYEETMLELFNDPEITPLDYLQRREKDLGREILNQSDYGATKSVYSIEVYESAKIYDICDVEGVGLKSRINADFGEVTPLTSKWEFIVSINQTPVYVVGRFDGIEEEKFEEIFESVICSLELHD